MRISVNFIPYEIELEKMEMSCKRHGLLVGVEADYFQLFAVIMCHVLNPKRWIFHQNCEWAEFDSFYTALEDSTEIESWILRRVHSEMFFIELFTHVHVRIHQAKERQDSSE